MAQTSWPFYNPSTGGTPVYEDQWSRMARQWAASGVVGYPNDTGLQVYANGSGREVHVRTGLACVRGHWFRSDAQETLAIAANTSGNPRIDRVVVRLAPSADGATLAVLAGTPAGSPSAPALTVTDTGVYELTLARVTVANGAVTITAGNVVDERVHVAPPTLLGTSVRRPAAQIAGQRLFEIDTGREVVWSGSAWEDTNRDRVAKSGDTMTGALRLDAAADSPADLHLSSNGTNRWTLRRWTNGDLHVQRRDASGDDQGAAVVVNADTGRVSLNRSTNNADPELTVVTKNYVDGLRTYVDDVSTTKVSKSGDTMTGDLVIKKSSNYSQVRLMTSTDGYWLSSDPGAGGFTIATVNAAGAFVATALKVDPGATPNVTILKQLTVQGVANLAGGATFNDTGVPSASPTATSGPDAGVDWRWLAYDATGRLRRVNNFEWGAYVLTIANSSSARFKSDIGDATDIPDVVNLTPRSFAWTPDGMREVSTPGERLGLIAEEAAEVDERLVTKDAEGRVQGLDYAALIAALVAKVTELQSRVESLED